MYDASIEINGWEYDLRLGYTYYRSIKGKRSFGEQIEPDEPAHVEIDSVHIKFGTDWESIELPDEVIEEYEQEILEEYQ